MCYLLGAPGRSRSDPARLSPQRLNPLCAASAHYSHRCRLHYLLRYGLAIIGTASGLLIEDAVLQGDQPLFLQNALAGGTRLLRMTAAGAPDTTLGPGGVRATGYVPTYESASPGTLAADQQRRGAGLDGRARDARPVPGCRHRAGGGPDVGSPGNGPGGSHRRVRHRGRHHRDGDLEPRPPTTAARRSPPTRSRRLPVGRPAPTACRPSAAPSPGSRTGRPTRSSSPRPTPSAPARRAARRTASPPPRRHRARSCPCRRRVRIVDSRATVGDTDDEQQERFGALNAGTTRAIPVAGASASPPTPRTPSSPSSPSTPPAAGTSPSGPAAPPMPPTCSLNFTKGVTLANTVLTKLGAGGTNDRQGLRLRQHHHRPRHRHHRHARVDRASSPLPSAAADRGLARPPSGDTDDEQQERFGALNAGTTRRHPRRRAGRHPHRRPTTPSSPSSPSTPPAAATSPCTPAATPRPSTSQHQLHHGRHPRQHRHHQARHRHQRGKVCVYTSTTTHLVIDIAGTFAPASFDALPAPKRIADSRATVGDTDDEQQERFGALDAGTTRAIPVAGRVRHPRRRRERHALRRRRRPHRRRLLHHLALRPTQAVDQRA